MGKALSGELSCPCDRSCFNFCMNMLWSLEPSHRDKFDKSLLQCDIVLLHVLVRVTAGLYENKE